MCCSPWCEVASSCSGTTEQCSGAVLVGGVSEQCSAIAQITGSATSSCEAPSVHTRFRPAADLDTTSAGDVVTTLLALQPALADLVAVHHHAELLLPLPPLPSECTANDSDAVMALQQERASVEAQLEQLRADADALLQAFGGE